LREGFKELEKEGKIKVEGHNILLEWMEKVVYTDMCRICRMSEVTVIEAC